MSASVVISWILKAPGAYNVVSDKIDIRELKLMAAARWPDADFTRFILALPDEVSREAYPEIAEAIARVVRAERRR